MPAPRKTDLARRAHELYRSGLSTRGVGRLLGISGESVGSLLKRHGFARRPRPTAAAIVVYKGDRYAPGKDGILRATNPTVRADPARLYLLRRIYTEHFGPIPQGHVVLSTSGDKSDLSPANLRCMSRGEAMKIVGARGNGHTRGYQLGGYPVKHCAACGREMKPHLAKKHPEPPSAFILRLTCGHACSRDLLRGKPCGTRHPKQTWKDYASKAPPKKQPRLETAQKVQWRTAEPTAHVGLAMQAAHKLARKLDCQVEELIGDAYIALTEAARTFRPEKGHRFSTHAVTALKFRLYKAAMEDRGRTRENRTGKRGWVDPLGLCFASDLARDGASDDGWNWFEQGCHLGHAARAASPDQQGGGLMTRVREKVEDTPTNARTKEIAADLADLFARGLTITQAAAAIGISVQYARQIKTTLASVVREVAA